MTPAPAGRWAACGARRRSAPQPVTSCCGIFQPCRHEASVAGCLQLTSVLSSMAPLSLGQHRGAFSAFRVWTLFDFIDHDSTLPQPHHRCPTSLLGQRKSNFLFILRLIAESDVLGRPGVSPAQGRSPITYRGHMTIAQGHVAHCTAQHRARPGHSWARQDERVSTVCYFGDKTRFGVP